MLPHFQHARRRLARSQKHIGDFVSTVRSFVDTNPPTYHVEPHFDFRKAGRRLLWIRMPPLPQEIEDYAVDAIAGPRATLDYAAYASAVSLGSTRLRDTYFPFGDDKAGLENTITGHKKCRDLHPEIVDLFRSFEPYNGGKGTLLWSLNKLRNEAEHTNIVSAAVRTSDAIIAVPDDVSPNEVDVFEPVWNSAKNEVMIAEFPPARNPDKRYNFQVTLSVAFPNGPGIANQSAGDLMEGLVSVIDGIVSATEAETARLLGGAP